MAQVIINGQEVDFDAAVNLMDDDIREKLHNDMTGATEQSFVDAYVAAHAEKYNEEFAVN